MVKLQEHEYKARDKTVQKMSRDGLREENLRNKKKESPDGIRTQRFPTVRKRMNWISVRKGVTGSMKRGKQNIQSKVPEKPDMVGKLCGTKIRNQI